MAVAIASCRKGLAGCCTLLAFTFLANLACGQDVTVENRRPGRRVDDDVIPTQVVKGTLISLERDGLVVNSDGKELAMAIVRDTRVELGAKGSLDFLVVGAIVEVSGEMTTEGTVLLRERGWEGIEVCVTGQPPTPPVERREEIVYTAPAGSQVIPFKFVGTVINREPLVVRPLSNYPQPRLGVRVPGQPIQKLPEFKNNDLTIETPKEAGTLKLNLGDRIDLLDEGSQATVNVAFNPNPVAVRVYIERNEPFKKDQIPDDKKENKDKKSGKNTKKTTGKKSATTPKAPKPANP